MNDHTVDPNYQVRPATTITEDWRNNRNKLRKAMRDNIVPRGTIHLRSIDDRYCIAGLAAILTGKATWQKVSSAPDAAYYMPEARNGIHQFLEPYYGFTPGQLQHLILLNDTTDSTTWDHLQSALDSIFPNEDF